jgi:hypothetical protein
METNAQEFRFSFLSFPCPCPCPSRPTPNQTIEGMLCNGYCVSVQVVSVDGGVYGVFGDGL